jgi:predicted Zn-dependent protease
MRVTRVVDVVVFVTVAVAVLLPRPDVKVKPGLELSDSQRVELAQLQSVLARDPGAIEPSLELSNLLLDGGRPELALSVLEPAIRRNPADHRLASRQSMAFADDWEGLAAYKAAERALALCENGSSHPCNESDRVRLTLMKSTFEKVKDIDLRDDPNSAKERILKALRPGRLPRH